MTVTKWGPSGWGKPIPYWIVERGEGWLKCFTWDEAKEKADIEVAANREVTITYHRMIGSLWFSTSSVYPRPTNNQNTEGDKSNVRMP